MMASSPVPVAKEPTFNMLAPPKPILYPDEVEAMVKLASKVMAFTISSKSMELEAAVVSVSVPQLNLPLVASHNSLLVAAVSQSDRPAPVNDPVNEWLAAVSAMNLPDIWRLPDMLAFESKKTLSFTSRSPVIKRSSDAASECPVASVPNLE